MAIEFSHLHNLVRTYHRSLRVEDTKAQSPQAPESRLDRVTISDEALQSVGEAEEATPQFSDPK